MIVSNDNQTNKLNILTAKNNNTAKEVLKEADVKTILTQNKELNLSTVLKSLFNSVGNAKQSNETILKLLKNTNISKDLGSFTSNLQQLLKSLPNNETTKSLKTFLENFLVNISNSKNSDIKEQISKSGVFLESKLAKQLNNPNPKNEASTLNDMKTVLLKTKAQLETQTTSQAVKQTINISETMKIIEKVLTQLTKNENISPSEIKNSLSNIKQNIQTQLISNDKNETMNQLDKLISKLPTNNLTNSTILNELKTTLTKVQTVIKNQIQQVQNSQMPKEQITSANETLKQVDKILSQLKNSEPISNNQIKTVLSDAKKQIENLSQFTQKQQTEIQNNQSKSTTSQLFALKAQIQNNTKEPIKVKEIIKQLSKILTQIDEIEAKPANLKQETATQNTTVLKNSSPTTSIFQETKTILTKIQNQLQTQLQTEFEDKTIDEIKTHIQSLKDNDSTEPLKQINKLLNQIDYHQLYSLANSSNNIYIPFLWDLLEDGSIDIKKSGDDKFYCIIDLTLKNLGNVDIHLYMFNQENLDISIYVEKDETKQLIREKISKLKQALFSSDIKVESISVNSKKTEDNSSKNSVYNQNDNFDFGLNIKV